MNKLGLSPNEQVLICGILVAYPQISCAKVFGSRAKGNARAGSDIDLALWGDLDASLVARVVGELDELPLPYTFDVQSYAAIQNPALRSHIDRVGKVIFQRE